MQPAATALPARALRPGGIGEARRLIQRQGVRAGQPCVVRRLGEYRRVRHVPQLGEVEDLQSIRRAAVGYEESIMLIHLDVAPQRSR